MEKYIPLDALVAEIERRVTEGEKVAKEIPSSAIMGLIQAYKNTLSIIYTLEVKEVDIENAAITEWNDYIKKIDGEPDYAYMLIKRNEYIELAKHFFELGMRVNNPITAADRGMVEEIIINLKRVEKDYRIDLTREMEWLRNKVKKGKEV